jgi:signal transduction histidine kinase
MNMPRLSLASFGRRILFRGVFLLLALATVLFALVLLQGEKERSWRDYRESFRKTRGEVLARLRHPAGMLALLNPGVEGAQVPLRPLVLPYAALDFDDYNKAQQAVELAGCSVRYPDGSSICVAVGQNPYAGGFIYLVGSFEAPEMVPRDQGALELSEAHRVRVSLTARGETLRYVAPFELSSDRPDGSIRGRLVGYDDHGETLLDADAAPVGDFRGWLWQAGACSDAENAPGCRKRAFFSVRVPVDVFRSPLFSREHPAWPPVDLDQVRVRVQVLPPGANPPVFDSDAPGATAPDSLKDLRRTLAGGETLQVGPAGSRQPPLVFKGEDEGERVSPLVARLLRLLPADASQPAPTRDTIVTPVGNFEVLLRSDARSVERNLAVVATRVSGYVGAMLAAIVLAWAVIEAGLIRRITVLSGRAAAVSRNIRSDRLEESLARLDVSDLRGRDELGVLAAGLDDLMGRVKEDVRREQLRAQQERDMLHAVGHEILSPLQSLMVLHPDPSDPARRYVQRMQQAVRVLYGQASPGEALQSADLQLTTVDLDVFLAHVAANAGFCGIADVLYQPHGKPVAARADEYSLEDVVTHILRNADRHRAPGTAIEISLQAADDEAEVAIHNTGPAIDDALLPRIFDYGVSGAAGAHGEHRGQGLFVARTYMAKMGGTVRALDLPAGACFELALPLAG